MATSPARRTCRATRSRRIPRRVERLAAKTVVLYCGDGATTAAAQRTLAQAGAKDVFSLRGGLAAWTQENLPVVKG